MLNLSPPVPGHLSSHKHRQSNRSKYRHPFMVWFLFGVFRVYFMCNSMAVLGLSFFLFKDSFLLMCMCLCECMLHVCRCLQKLEEGGQMPWSWRAGSYRPPNVDTVNWTPVLWKSSKHREPRSHLSSPCPRLEAPLGTWQTDMAAHTWISSTCGFHKFEASRGYIVSSVIVEEVMSSKSSTKQTKRKKEKRKTGRTEQNSRTWLLLVPNSIPGHHWQSEKNKKRNFTSVHDEEVKGRKGKFLC